jgi:predicted alpha/beta-fold hydrolase
MKMKSIIYRRAITENFKWLLRKHLKEMESCIDTHKIDIEKAMQASHPSEFDEYFTRRLFNYPDTDQMY